VIRRIAAAVLASVCIASAAHADIRPGVKVGFKGLTVSRAGVPINAQAVIQSSQPVTIKQFALGMRGTTVNSDAPTDSLLLPANGMHTVNLSVIPSNNDDDLTFEFVANGHKFVFKRNLSQFWSDLRNYGQTVGFDPQPEPPAPAAQSSHQHQVAPEVPDPAIREGLDGQPIGDIAQARRMAQALGSTAVETHTLKLRLRYERPDNTKDDVDGASYTIYWKTPGMDFPIASGISDADGRLEHTVQIESALGRDFFVRFRTTNGWVHVLNNNDDDDPYKFKSAQFGGKVGGGVTERSFLVASNGPATPAIHMLTTITRGFRFVLAETPYTYDDDIDDLDVSWPESDWPHYTWPVYETMYIPSSGWEWTTRTFLHEFGHHVNWELPLSINQIGYDDGNCEAEGSTGRHCRWCAEDDPEVATMEGFASWFGDMVASKYTSNYGSLIYDPDGDIDGELLGGLDDPAGDCPRSGSAVYRVEGHYWALLRDLADDTNESDPNYHLSVSSLPPLAQAPQDRLSLGFAAILDILCDVNVDVVTEFRDAFFSRYNGSLDASDIWNTFANAGYWYDTTPPGLVPSITSSDHTPNVSSPDNSITFNWTPAVDTQSGIGDHNIWLYKNGSIDQVGPNEAHPQNTITFSDLGPGNYQLRVEPRDRAGNSALASTYSPTYVIRDPYPTDLARWARSGWDNEKVIPRMINNSTSGNVIVAPYLYGDKDSTWFNWAIQNTGEVDVTSTFRTRLVIDGVVVDSVMSTTSLGVPNNTHTVINRGPFNIRPGRHTIEVWTDAEEEIAEPSESNNRFGQQWVWHNATNMTRNADIVAPAPPRRDGGWNTQPLVIGQPKIPNVSAHRFTHMSNFFPITTTRWMATEIWPEPEDYRDRSGVNYDLRLDYYDRDSYYGFVDTNINSTRGNNLTDAVITNATNTGNSVWEVGVENMSNDNNDYHVRTNTGGTLLVGDSVDVNLENNQMVAIRGIDVTAANVGKIIVEVQRIAGTSPVRISYLGASTIWATLSQALGDVPVNNLGWGTLTIPVSTAGFPALLLWRDPSDGTAHTTYRVKIKQKPADLAIVTPSGWSAPLVPRATNDATSALAPSPPILYGDDKPTYVSASRRNPSDVAGGSHTIKLMVDDLTMFSYSGGSIAALTTVTNPNVATLTIPGGRHVITQVLDPSGLMVEVDEVNNTFGQQFVWTPDTVLSDQQRWRRGQLGGVTSGWEYCLPSAQLYFDMDGVRLPTWNSGSGVDFAAVAVSARDTADVDMGLYLTSNNATGGFLTPQEDSNWGPGETELLLLNFTMAQRKAYDIGIQRVSDDTSSYVVDVVPGVVRNPATPTHGPFTLAASRLVHVHQFALPVGRHTIHLRNLSGNADLGLSAYDAKRPFQDRSQGEERGWSYEAAAGADEEIVLIVDQPSTIAIAVYKTRSSETAKSASYQLELGNNTTDSPVAGMPASTRLAGAFPNPARGAAAVHFDLARDGDVELEVYDLRGARVRTLARGPHAAGRHRAAWDGRDTQGRVLPAGVYLLRMQAPGYVGHAKLVRAE